ncbi:MAG: hypothetical protein AB7T49_21340 [Oligoflexales bacterium]|nr:hypothetical protein [Nitrosomonas nitrosa]
MIFFKKSTTVGQYQYSLPAVIIVAALAVLGSIIVDRFVYSENENMTDLWVAAFENPIPVKADPTPTPVPNRIKILAEQLKEKYFQSKCDSGISYVSKEAYRGIELIEIKDLKMIIEGAEASEFDKVNNKLEWSGTITFKVKLERRAYWSREEPSKTMFDDWRQFEYDILRFGVWLRNGKEGHNEAPGYNTAPTCDQVRQIKSVALANSRK